MHLGSEFLTNEELEKLNFGKIGNNVKIKRNASLYFTENIFIGDNVRIDDFTVVVASREPVIFHDYILVASQCYIAGSDGFLMESFSTLAPGVKIYTGSDDYSGEKLTNPTVPEDMRGGPCGPVKLCEHVIVGSSSVIFPDLTINEGCSIGALSLVNKSLDSWGIYCGTPATFLRSRSKNLLKYKAVLKSRELE